MHIDYLDCVKKNNIGRIGLIILVVICLAALFAPLLTGYQPLTSSAETLQPPSAGHLLGTNDIGQDIFTRVIYGARNSLVIAFSVGILTVLIGAVLGGSAALIGGLYERIIMRMVDVLLTLPNILVIILAAAYIRPGLGVLIFLLSIINWHGPARIIRAQALSLKNRHHVQAAEIFGANYFYILRKHIIPDLGPIMVSGFIQHARLAVFMEAGLAFLGIADPVMVSWGTMLNNALEFSFLNAWYWIIPPGIALSLTVISFTFLGYALEEILNPRLRVERNA